MNMIPKMWSLFYTLIAISISSAKSFKSGNGVAKRISLYDKQTFLKRFVQRGENDRDVNGSDKAHDDEEQGDNSTPYKSRSLAWTNRYRQLIPYELARAQAIALGFSSKAEWDAFLEDGEGYTGPYLPSRPELMYHDDWVGWEEFLGVTRPYEEARALVKTLGLQNFDDYQRFVSADTKRAEGLRIPAKPHIVYRGKGWISFEAFFGSFD